MCGLTDSDVPGVAAVGLESTRDEQNASDVVCWTGTGDTPSAGNVAGAAGTEELSAGVLDVIKASALHRLRHAIHTGASLACTT